jgi:hypothetical protein
MKVSQNAVIDFLDAEPVAGEHGGDVDFLAVHADAAAGCDEDVAVMEGVVEVREAGVGL